MSVYVTNKRTGKTERLGGGKIKGLSGDTVVVENEYWTILGTQREKRLFNTRDYEIKET